METIPLTCKKSLKYTEFMGDIVRRLIYVEEVDVVTIGEEEKGCTCECCGVRIIYCPKATCL